jgi:hypothetical protein
MKVAFLLLALGLLVLGTVSKPIVAGKVIVALNCGSKDEVVDSHDKVFKYQGVRICLCRMRVT